MYKIERYKTESGECPLDEFVKELHSNGCLKEAAKIEKYIRYLEEFGFMLPGMNKQIAERLEEDIYELRPLPNRVLYTRIDKEDIYLLLHAFKKKTNKTPPEEIDKAKKEKKDYEGRI